MPGPRKPRSSSTPTPPALPTWLPPSQHDRPVIDRLRVQVWGLAAAERRLKWGHRDRGAVSHGRMPALVTLMQVEEITPSQLAREAELTPATVTGMLDELETQGVIRRRPDDKDRRKSWVSLTERGRTEVAEMKVEWDRRWAAGLAEVSDEELEAACRVLERLTATFDDAVKG